MTEGEAALRLALRLLRKSDRLEGELRARLSAAGFSDQAADEALGVLKARKFVDDERVIDDLVERRTSVDQRGKGRVLAELARRGADEPVLEEVAGRFPPAEEAARADAWLAQRPFADAGRAYRFLLAKGFDVEIAREAVERRFGGTSD